jgi:hypothetical protein
MQGSRAGSQQSVAVAAVLQAAYLGRHPDDKIA